VVATSAMVPPRFGRGRWVPLPTGPVGTVVRLRRQRPMTERDSDIDFDFFDEPETQETTQRRRAPRDGRGPGGPRRGGRPPIAMPGGLTPLLRLTLLVVFAIFLIVVLVLWVQGCQGASKRSEYAGY